MKNPIVLNKNEALVYLSIIVLFYIARVIILYYSSDKEFLALFFTAIIFYSVSAAFIHGESNVALIIAAIPMVVFGYFGSLGGLIDYIDNGSFLA